MAGLYLSLLIRAAGFPAWKLLRLHILPFAIIFGIWILVFYIAGLYDLRTVIFRERLTRLLVNTQLVNSGIVIFVFYFVPAFIISPKTILLLDLVFTLIFLFGWRTTYLRNSSSMSGERALIVGESHVAQELRSILARIPHFGLTMIDTNPSVIIIDMSDPDMISKYSQLVPLIFTGVRFLDLQKVYEEISGRVPLDLISDKWILENISLQPKPIYTLTKRVMDIVIALPLAILTCIYWPLVWLAHMIEDRGGLFSFQTRVGQNDGPIKLMKLRTMNNANDGGKWANSNKNKTTRVGEFLRRTRLDEFPQLWNVIRGDLSLIGPRPEFPDPVREYEKNIPYYKLRHIIKPGLSGWAQINQIENPHHEINIDLTRDKLSYDLYYLKNRSFLLDLKISLKTIKTVLSRVGA